MARKRSSKTYTLAQKLADPKKRAKLPMSALSPQQQQWRRRRLEREKIAQDPLYNPAVPLTGTALHDAVQRSVGLEFDPQQRALEQQLSNVSTQGRALQGTVAGSYADLAAREQDAIGRQQGLAKSLDDQLAQMAQRGSAAFDQADQRLNAAKMDSRGFGTAGFEGSQGELEHLRERDRYTQGAVRSNAAVQSEGFNQLLNVMAQARAMQGEEAQQALRTGLTNDQNTVRQGLQDLAKQRGAAAAQRTLDLRQSAITNQLAQQELGADLAALQSKEEQARLKRIADARRAKGDRESRETVAGMNASERAADRRQRAEDARRRRALDLRLAQLKKTGATKESESARSDRVGILNIADEIAKLHKDNSVKRLRGKTGGARRTALAELIRERARRAKQTPPPDYMLGAALDLVAFGKLTPAKRRRLEAMGINVDALIR